MSVLSLVGQASLRNSAGLCDSAVKEP
jgi:hypothetical protein